MLIEKRIVIGRGCQLRISSSEHFLKIRRANNLSLQAIRLFLIWGIQDLEAGSVPTGSSVRCQDSADLF